MRSSNCLLLLLLSFGLFGPALAGCQTQRPVDQLRDRGDFYFERGDYRAAIDEYQEIADRYPGDWRAQHQLGRAALQLELFSRAQRALEVAHTLRPANHDIADDLAEALLQVGSHEQLFAFLRERAESSQSPRAWRQLGRYAMELGDPDSARTAFERAIIHDDGRSVEPYLDAARFAEEIGDLEVAVRRLRQAYGIDPRHREVRERLINLGEIPGPTLALPPGR